MKTSIAFVGRHVSDRDPQRHIGMPFHQFLNDPELAVDVAEGANLHGQDRRDRREGRERREGRAGLFLPVQPVQPVQPFQPYGAGAGAGALAAGTSRSSLSQTKSALLYTASS